MFSVSDHFILFIKERKLIFEKFVLFTQLDKTMQHFRVKPKLKLLDFILTL